MAKYIYSQKDWTNFIWNKDRIMPLLVSVRNMQGKLLGKMLSVGFSFKAEAMLSTITLDLLKSVEIEGE